MLGSLLITLREGLEASLIVGIILAYLAKTGNKSGFRAVWWGTALAVLVSLVVGGAVYFLIGELQDPAEAIFEGSILFLAVAVLTWMIFWMRTQAINIKGALQAQIDSALSNGTGIGLALIAFFAVVREGIETVLFLLAIPPTADSPILFAVGGVLGLAAAVMIGYTIYKGSARLNLRMFFNATSVLLIVFAAGLLAQGVHEFNELGFIPSLIEHVWDSNALISVDSTMGHFLTAIFGYNASPSLTEALAYFAYLVLVLTGYFYSRKSNQPKKKEKITAVTKIQNLTSEIR